MLSVPQKRSQPGWWIVGVLFLVSAGVLISWSSRPRRIEYVSNIDPNTGYRCRFTIAADWKLYRSPDYPGPNPTILDYQTFTPRPKPPLIEWICMRVLHQDLKVKHKDFMMLHCPSEYASAFIVEEGYPQQLDTPAQQVCSRRHMRLDGQPATLTAYAASNNYGYVLLVKPKQQTIFYEFAFSAEEANVPGLQDEMEQIASYFRLEKVR